MTTFLQHPIVCILLLYLTVILLWYPKTFPGSRIPFWFFTAILSIVVGFFNHLITFSAIIPLVLLMGITYRLGRSGLSRQRWFLLSIALFCLGALLGLELHALPGFHNIRVLNQVMITPDAVPFTLYWNIDKSLVGIFILGFMVPLIHQWSDGWLVLKKTFLPGAFIIFVIGLLAFPLKFVHFSPKLSLYLFVWMPTNLLFTCMAEEAFFRGFVQRYLSLWFKHVKEGPFIAIIISALLFGLSHHAGWSFKYMLLATFAGVGYGWIYWRTKSIEASIVTHFSLNLIHFIFFTYPALMSGFR